MHDILEGSLQYEIKELLKYLIYSAHYLTIDKLNQKINTFPYVLSDKNSKPIIISSNTLLSRDHSLKQKGKNIYTYLSVHKCCMQCLSSF